MKSQFLLIKIVFLLFCFPFYNFSQSPNIGTSEKFVLFTSIGAVTNTGNSLFTGNVGTNLGSSTGFGNVDGIMHDNDGASAQCNIDLTSTYNQLEAAIPNFFPSSTLGNGQQLIAGVYSITSAATLNDVLILDAQNDPNAIFIFKIDGAFSTSANSQVNLVNGALACNVFWKIEGLVDLAAETIMKGTIVVNNAAIILNNGVVLEGRALSTSGAITVNGVNSYKPSGCGINQLTGPNPPSLNSTICYTIFSTNGSVANSGLTYATGDIGTNVGLTTGYDPLNVTGLIHPIPDASTATASADLLLAYNFLNNLSYDIELLYPAQFGNNLVLTPHTYLLNAATLLTGNVYLNAENNPDAVFVIQINGALSTSTYSKVFLINGTQAKNVYWKIDGATSISDYSEFKGTIVCNNGAINLLLGVQLEGRAMTTTGAISTNSVNSIMPPGCESMQNIQNSPENRIAVFYPNPFKNIIYLNLQSDNYLNNSILNVYDLYGREVFATDITELYMMLDLSKLSSGIYLYTIRSANKTIQMGKFLSQ
jgi:hypothetical protein